MPDKQTLTNYSIAVLVFGLFTYTYFNFSTFRPKALAEVREVRGTQTKRHSTDLAHPINSQKISTNTTSEGEIITLKTTDSIKDTQEFYKNVLTSKGWKIDTERQAGVFSNTKYKKNSSIINVALSKQSYDSNLTIISIEVFDD